MNTDTTNNNTSKHIMEQKSGALTYYNNRLISIQLTQKEKLKLGPTYLTWLRMKNFLQH